MKRGHAAAGPGTYVRVWGGLLVLTAVTVAVSFVDLGLGNVTIALLVASLKATLVALYFMHLRSESRLVWAFALTPLFFLFLILAGTVGDVIFRRAGY